MDEQALNQHWTRTSADCCELGRRAEQSNYRIQYLDNTDVRQPVPVYNGQGHFLPGGVDHFGYQHPREKHAVTVPVEYHYNSAVDDTRTKRQIEAENLVQRGGTRRCSERGMPDGYGIAPGISYHPWVDADVAYPSSTRADCRNEWSSSRT